MIFLEGNLAICIKSHILWHTISTSRNLSKGPIWQVLLYTRIFNFVLFIKAQGWKKLTCPSMKNWLNQLWRTEHVELYLWIFKCYSWFLIGWKNKTKQRQVAKQYMWCNLLIEKFKSVYLPVYARKKVGHGVDSGVIISDLCLLYVFCSIYWFNFYYTHILWIFKSIKSTYYNFPIWWNIPTWYKIWYFILVCLLTLLLLDST